MLSPNKYNRVIFIFGWPLILYHPKNDLRNQRGFFNNVPVHATWYVRYPLLKGCCAPEEPLPDFRGAKTNTPGTVDSAHRSELVLNKYTHLNSLKTVFLQSFVDKICPNNTKNKQIHKSTKILSIKSSNLHTFS